MNADILDLFPNHHQPASAAVRELIIDSFAGGGGASTGIEMALSRSPDFAINHDAEALALHAANHPETIHLSENIWKVDPLDVVEGRPVGLAWFSPDCKHFSKAKGGKPVKKNIRDLAWVIVNWAKRARPRVIFVENVEEFQGWGPLDENNQPCKDRKGETFRKWVKALKAEGYKIEWRELRACDYGAPTIRKRLFIIARRDGLPIVWPEPTHGKPDDPDVIAGKKKPWRTAAEIIDWSLPCPSIFMTKEEAKVYHKATGDRVNRPLAEATMARIAKGVKRYVLDNPKPFIVTVNHQGEGFRGQGLDDPFMTVTSARDGHGLIAPVLRQSEDDPAHFDIVGGSHVPVKSVVNGDWHCAACGEGNASTFWPTCEWCIHEHELTATAGIVRTDMTSAFKRNGVHGPDEPLRTQATATSFAVVNAGIARVAHGDVDRNGKKRGQGQHSPSEPLPTVTASPEFSVIGAQLCGVGGRMGQSRPRSADEPMQTATAKADTVLITPHVMTMRNAEKPHNGADEPAHTITAGGAGLSLVAAHMTKFNTGATGSAMDEPVHTVTAAHSDYHPGAAVPLGLVAATMVQTGYGEREGQEPRALDLEKPLGTVVAEGQKHAAVAAFLAQHNNHTGTDPHAGREPEKPLSTITGSGSHQAVVSAGMINMKGSDQRSVDVEEPVSAICAQGNHVAEVRTFLFKYYGNEDGGHSVEEPLGTVTTKDRFGIVTIEGVDYVIADIGMRMLNPRELYRAQGFPPTYQIEIEFNGKPLPKSSQTRMCGNSVCPPMAAALVAANCPDLAEIREAAE